MGRIEEPEDKGAVDVRVPEREGERNCLQTTRRESFLCVPHNCSPGLASSIDLAKAARFRERWKLSSGTRMATSEKLQDISS